VTVALQDTEVDAPGTDGFAVLVGHEPRELVEVGKVVDGPCGKELAKGNGAECRVVSAALKVLRAKI